VWSYLVQAAGHECGGWYSEFRIIRPRDGQVAWLEEHSESSFNPHTGQMGIAGVVWDLTDR
jgi:PAS domain S-box-containing protein